jgi:serine/threonine protein kinase
VLYEMIFGTVPFKSSNVEYLVYDICNKIPSFKHENPFTKKPIEVTEKLRDLILALLNPNPDDRISHSYLFSLVLDDSNFEREYNNNSPDSHIGQSGITNNSSAVTDSIFDSFLAQVKKERSKYSRLIEIAKQLFDYRQ